MDIVKPTTDFPYNAQNAAYTLAGTAHTCCKPSKEIFHLTKLFNPSKLVRLATPYFDRFKP